MVQSITWFFPLLLSALIPWLVWGESSTPFKLAALVSGTTVAQVVPVPQAPVSRRTLLKGGYVEVARVQFRNNIASAYSIDLSVEGEKSASIRAKIESPGRKHGSASDPRSIQGSGQPTRLLLESSPSRPRVSEHVLAVELPPESRALLARPDAAPLTLTLAVQAQ